MADRWPASTGTGRGLSPRIRVAAAEEVLGMLPRLLEASSLAWELHAEQWANATDNDATWAAAEHCGSAHGGDEWAVVERPAVPTPSQLEEVHMYEASVHPRAPAPQGAGSRRVA